MDTKTFLDLVLPSAGYRCIATIHDGHVKHRYGTDNAWAADQIERLDREGVGGIYHACGGFNNREDGRVQANVLALRSFWLDIDTQEGKPKETYADRREAIQQLAAFSKELHLPIPLLVDSGFGIHAYWPLTEDVDAITWKRTALILKRAAKKWGLAVDPSRTSDSASILRPAGSYNRKFDGARVVKVLRSCEPIALQHFHLALTDYAGEELPVENLNMDLMSREFAASDATQIAAQCGAIAHVRDTGGDVPEPYWFAALSVLARTTQGDAICHEWSSGYHGYSQSETESKIAHVRSGGGPATCESFSNYSDACRTCPLWGEIKSPITLGEGRAICEPVNIEEMLLPGETPEMFNHTGYPRGYGFGLIPGETEPCLYYTKQTSMTDEFGEAVKIDVKAKLLSISVLPVGRIATSDDLYSMNIRVKDKRATRDFIMDNGLVAEGGSALYRELGRHEVNVPASKRNEFTSYLNAWIGHLRDHHDKVPSIDQYGWHNDGFVVGTDYVTPSGTNRAVLTGGAGSMGKHLQPVGTLKAWVDAVDQAYNVPGDEGLQYSVLLAFAAPLWSMFQTIGGVTVYAHSTGSGFGKTTAQCAGLGAWGEPAQLMLAQDNFTAAGLQQHLGIMNHLPVVVDELTDAPPEFLSHLLYAVSAGKGKTRLNPDATMKKVYNWSTIAMTSGNDRITEKLSLHKSNASPQMARVWEFTLSRYGDIPVNEATRLFGTFNKNYGHAGRVYMEYLTKNRTTIETMLYAMREAFNDQCGIHQQERYWSMLNACVLTALSITQKLDLIRFDRSNLLSWIEQTLEINRGQIGDNISTPLDTFCDMLADLGDGVLVTIGEGNLTTKEGAAIVEKDPRGPLIGRHILDIPSLNGKPSASREEMHLASSAIKQWCGKKGASPKEMFDALVACGWADAGSHRMVLGKGTFKYSGVTGSTRCWKINLPAIRSADGGNTTAKKILGVVTNTGGSLNNGIAARSK